MSQDHYVFAILTSPLPQTFENMSGAAQNLTSLHVINDLISKTGQIIWFLTKNRFHNKKALQRNIMCKISREPYKCLIGHNRQRDITVMLKIDIYILAICQSNKCLNF